MSTASFAVAPQTPESFAVWSFSHMAHHRDIIRRIFETKGKSLLEYALDPFDPRDVSVWSDQHQSMHNDMNQALYGSGGADLSQIDWSDEETLSLWLAQNYAEHAQAGTTLGV